MSVSSPKTNSFFILYVDDACIISPHEHKISQVIASLQNDFDLTNKGKLQDYLGTRFQSHSDGSFTLTQPRLINRVFDIVGLDKDCNVKHTRHPSNQDPTFWYFHGSCPRLELSLCRRLSLLYPSYGPARHHLCYSAMCTILQQSFQRT